jgi:hypothetical protein
MVDKAPYQFVIGLAAREESTGLAWWFFVVAGVTALLLVWFITRFGVQLNIWQLRADDRRKTPGRPGVFHCRHAPYPPRAGRRTAR